MDIVCFHVNISPSSLLDDNIPHEVWNGKKPSLKIFIVFGCDGYVHITKESMGKWDKKVEKCTFIIYKDGLKIYNLWNQKIK